MWHSTFLIIEQSSPTSKHQAVSTASAISDITSVEADIKYYAAWSKYNGAHIAICDEAPSYTKDDIFSYMSNVLSFVIETLGVGRDHVSFNHTVLLVRLSAPLRIPAASSRTHGIQEPAGSDARSWTRLPIRRMLYTAPWVMIWSRQAVKPLSSLRCAS